MNADARSGIRIRSEDRRILRKLGLDRFVDGHYYRYFTVMTKEALEEEGVKNPTISDFIAKLSEILHPHLMKNPSISRKLLELSPEERNETVLILSLAITQRAIREKLVKVRG